MTPIVPKIKAAAVRYQGHVYIGLAHFMIVDYITQLIGKTPLFYEEGFITDSDKYVDRFEAAAIAHTAGQVQYRPARLLSNMVYMRDIDNTVIQLR